MALAGSASQAPMDGGRRFNGRPLPGPARVVVHFLNAFTLFQSFRTRIYGLLIPILFNFYAFPIEEYRLGAGCAFLTVSLFRASVGHRSEMGFNDIF